jgi:probable F420-dependent oxidoreductase
VVPKVALNIVPVSGQLMVAAGRRAEELGYESVWLGEHLFIPAEVTSAYPAGQGKQPFGAETPWLDPLLALAAVAGATDSIRLGVGIHIAPLRHPLLTAKAFVTLDHVSGGRFDFGWGVGWLRDEFDVLGRDFSRRGKDMEEILTVWQKLFHDAVTTHSGPSFPLPPISFFPKPLPGPRWSRLVGGGYSPVAFDRAARYDGWYGHLVRLDPSTNGGSRWDPVVVKRFTAQMRERRERLGLDPASFEITGAVLSVPTREQLEVLADAGVDRVVVNPWEMVDGTYVGVAKSLEPAESLATAIGLSVR